MAAHCQVTGSSTGLWTQHRAATAAPSAGGTRTSRRSVTGVPSLRRSVTLNLSAKGIKVIDARGIDSVVG